MSFDAQLTGNVLVVQTMEGFEEPVGVKMEISNEGAGAQVSSDVQ